MPKTPIPKIKVMQVTAKCSDMFTANLIDARGEKAGEYDGYVPDFFPGQHYGDYVELDIDIETGMILNWKKPTQTALKKLLTKG